MKRGLKDDVAMMSPVPGIAVTTVTPMKRGLKATETTLDADLGESLQPLPR